MLEAINLTRSWNGHQALAGVSLAVAPGEIYCLLGANGAGKTTTINCFLGFVRPDGGKALVGGVDVTTDPQAARQRIAYIPETVMLYANLTGIENLEYFSALAGRTDLSRDRLATLLTEVGLDPGAADRRVGTYSKGMRQKVGVAMALAREAKALLLDEPTSGLDPQASNEFSALLRRLAGDGVAILMATHDLFRAREVGTRVGIMKRGRLVAEHSTESLGHADLEQLYLEQMAAV